MTCWRDLQPCIRRAGVPEDYSTYTWTADDPTMVTLQVVRF